MPKKKSDKYQKWAVILIGILFLTSMAGIALDSSSAGQKEVELPGQFILGEDISDQQRSAIYNTGGSVVVFESDPLCGTDCLELNRDLESLVYKYQGYVYLVTLFGEGDTRINVGNYLGDVDLNRSDAGEVEDKVCEVIPGHPACIERRAMAAVFNYNYTANDTDEAGNGTADDVESDAEEEPAVVKEDVNATEEVA
ncbi:MAG: hypothetical protein ABIG84_08130 [archaeon]